MSAAASEAIAARTGEFKKGWGTIVASAAGLAFGVATLAVSYSIGVFIGPLNEEFGWSRAQILVVTTVVTLAVAALSPVVGWITDQLGVRRLIIASQLGFGASFFALGLLTYNLWSFYALYFVMAMLGAGTIAVTFAKLITAEFVKHRGLALGLAMSGTGICGFLVPPFAANVVEAFGWRMGFCALGLLPLLICLPLSLRFLHDPIATTGDVAAAMSENAGSPGDASLVQACKNYRFWAMGMLFLLGSSTISSLITNFVPILGDQGYAATQAATIAGSFGIAVIAGRVIVGTLIDRFWAPAVGFVFFMPAAIAIAFLASGSLGTTAIVAAILVVGFAAGAEVDLMGYLVARYFGLTHFGKIYAGLYVLFALGPGIIVPLFGRARDIYGVYGPGMYAIAIAMGIAALLLLSLGRYPTNIGAQSPET